MMPFIVELANRDIKRGMPRTMDSEVAREKLRTVVTDMTVEAKQRLKALSTSGSVPNPFLYRRK
jgi:hypothetical protein